MEYLTYQIDEESFKGYYIPDIFNRVDKAVYEWNRVLKGYVKIIRFGYPINSITKGVLFSKDPDIIIRLGNVEHKTYAAQCKDLKGKWTITFNKNITWDIGKNKLSNWFKKKLGIGEIFQSSMIHEIGHIFDFHHSEDEMDVMHTPCKVTKFTALDVRKLKYYYENNNV